MKNFLKGLLALAVLLFFFLLSRFNFLLFHVIIELYSILIGIMIFILSTSTYQFVKTNYFTFIGISYLFVSLLDFTHTLVYKGMNIFPFVNTANYATQFWISARYLEAVSLFLSPFFIKRKLKLIPTYLGYFLYFIASLLSIFYFKNFPACYIEGFGLTTFKIASEYVISLILLLAIYNHWKNKDYFDLYVLKLLIFSIVSTIISEMFFTLYVDVYGMMNAMGHIFKLISFYLIYMSIVETSLRSPYRTIFYEFLKESKSFKDYIEYAGIMFLILDTKGNILLINKRGEEILGYKREEIIGKNWFENFVPEEIRDELRKYFEFLIRNNAFEQEDKFKENPVKTRDGIKIIRWYNTILRDEKGKIVGVISSGEDITEKKKEEDFLKYLASVDPLTGVYNKRVGFEIFQKEMGLSLVRNSPLAVVFVDIDGLKKVNDNFGHNEGDVYIKIITEAIKKNIRKTDTLFRFGGDEFVLILPHCDRETAERIIEKILVNLKKLREELNKPYEFSFSYGIAVFYPKEDKSIDDLVREADMKMYEMKKIKNKEGE